MANSQTAEPMTRQRFASAASRIAELAANLTADSAHWPPDRLGERALRFCTAIESLTAMIREEVQDDGRMLKIFCGSAREDQHDR